MSLECIQHDCANLGHLQPSCQGSLPKLLQCFNLSCLFFFELDLPPDRSQPLGWVYQAWQVPHFMGQALEADHPSLLFGGLLCWSLGFSFLFPFASTSAFAVLPFRSSSCVVHQGFHAPRFLNLSSTSASLRIICSSHLSAMPVSSVTNARSLALRQLLPSCADCSSAFRRWATRSAAVDPRPIANWSRISDSTRSSSASVGRTALRRSRAARSEWTPPRPPSPSPFFVGGASLSGPDTAVRTSATGDAESGPRELCEKTDWTRQSIAVLTAGSHPFFREATGFPDTKGALVAFQRLAGATAFALLLLCFLLALGSSCPLLVRCPSLLVLALFLRFLLPLRGATARRVTTNSLNPGPGSRGIQTHGYN